MLKGINFFYSLWIVFLKLSRRFGFSTRRLPVEKPKRRDSFKNTIQKVSKKIIHFNKQHVYYSNIRRSLTDKGTSHKFVVKKHGV